MLKYQTTLVHGNGTQERFFEFVLDVVSVLMDGKSGLYVGSGVWCTNAFSS